MRGVDRGDGAGEKGSCRREIRDSRASETSESESDGGGVVGGAMVKAALGKLTARVGLQC